MTTRLCAVGGTWAYASDEAKRGSWWNVGSPWWEYMRSHDVIPVGQRPFTWTSNVGGLFTLHRGGRFSDWSAGGDALRNYFESPTHPDCPFDVALTDRRIVAHSHGGQVVLHACAQGLRIHTLITIGTPVRDDMRYVMDQARPRIGYWLSVSDASLWRNKMQWLGSVTDGHLGVRWHYDVADVKLTVPDVGHSLLLYDPRTYHLWADTGMLDTLRRA